MSESECLLIRSAPMRGTEFIVRMRLKRVQLVRRTLSVGFSLADLARVLNVRDSSIEAGADRSVRSLG
jgi:hypothetical protein